MNILENFGGQREAFALAKLSHSPATFAVLLALLPATAAVVGAVALRQWPHGWEVVGLLCVSAAIVLTAVPARRRRDG